MVKAIYLNKEVMLKMLNLHDRDWKEFYIKDIFFINPGKRLTKTNMIDGNKPFIGATDSNNGVTAFVSNSNISEDRDINDLKSRAASLSKSEHLFLAIFLQQYNNDLNSYINNFNQIPSLVSIDTHNKAKLVELIDFFDSFPLLFNGERIR